MIRKFNENMAKTQLSSTPLTNGRLSITKTNSKQTVSSGADSTVKNGISKEKVKEASKNKQRDD
jgi:hypothetical protein